MNRAGGVNKDKAKIVDMLAVYQKCFNWNTTVKFKQ